MAAAEIRRIAPRRALWLALVLAGALVLTAWALPRTASAYWVPSPTESWQWNLAIPIEPTVDAEIYDIDAFENEASVVAALHAEGRHVVCYMDAGSWENWRPDASEFPASVLGDTYEGFTNERWLDIETAADRSIIEAIMAKRMEMCKAKGFDGVEADNVEGWENKTGFNITPEDQLIYNEWLANEAHSLGLSIALKNDVEQTKELVPYFDWDLTEECAGRKECGDLKPFTEAHKAVWSVEYSAYKLKPSQFCPEANKEGFMAVQKNVELDAWNAPCWAQGDWVGKKGAEGYDLAAFNGSSDLVNLPSGVTVTLVKGSRVTWASSTTDPRALESPTGSTRTAAAYSDPSEVQVQLHFTNAYKGNLHLYAVDWETEARRETITAGTQTATMAGTPTQTAAEDEKANHGFNQGSWVSFPINVAAGTTLPIDVKRSAGTSAVLSAIMLGGAEPSPTVSTAPEGTWLSSFGAGGYDLADWDGVQDVSELPNASVTLTKGSRYQWAANTTEVRALESPDGLTRNAATYYDPNEIQLQLSFKEAYSGN
ncbi:MAG TPA: endo alpha-1,4 polygalactosaminidase, partial [Solirubrobacteraceae bacterium]|nr:endo alpha-1,4 polygalactosaminidase [Solirubrobacteraceae bacterium]